MKTIRFLWILIFSLSLQFLTNCKDQNSVPNTLENGLIAFYNFNNNTKDQSGNGLDGTAFGGKYCSESTDNESYNFNGSGDYILVKNSQKLNPSNAITISLWFKPVEYIGVGFEALVLKPFTSHNPPYYQYILGLAGNYGLYPHNFSFSVNVNGVFTVVRSETNMWKAGTWYNVVGMYDGHILKLYVNGLLKNSYTSEGSIISYDTDLFLAKQQNIGTYTPGTMDNLRIYNRAISESEVADLYQELTKMAVNK